MIEPTIEYPIIGRLPLRKAIFVVEYVRDFSARRAAEACGRQPDWGYDQLKDDEIVEAIQRVVIDRQKNSDIDAEWLLRQAVDNHYIARQHGNLAASNAALNLIAKHRVVDALASEKRDITSGGKELQSLTSMSADRVREISQALEDELNGITDAVIVEEKPVSFM